MAPRQPFTPVTRSPRPHTATRRRGTTQSRSRWSTTAATSPRPPGRCRWVPIRPPVHRVALATRGREWPGQLRRERIGERERPDHLLPTRVGLRLRHQWTGRHREPYVRDRRRAPGSAHGHRPVRAHRHRREHRDRGGRASGCHVRDSSEPTRSRPAHAVRRLGAQRPRWLNRLLCLELRRRSPSMEARHDACICLAGYPLRDPHRDRFGRPDEQPDPTVDRARRRCRLTRGRSATDPRAPAPPLPRVCRTRHLFGSSDSDRQCRRERNRDSAGDGTRRAAHRRIRPGAVRAGPEPVCGIRRRRLERSGRRDRVLHLGLR
jgi:hypothetical protein